MKTPRLFQSLSFRIIFPVVVIALLFGSIGVMLIKDKMDAEVDFNVKKGAASRLYEVYHYIEIDYKKLLEDFGGDKKKLAQEETILQKELLDTMRGHVDSSQTYSIIIEDRQEKRLFAYTNGAYLGDDLHDGSYIIQTKTFQPWGWRISVLVNKSKFDYITRNNTIFVVLTILLIVLFTIIALLAVVRFGVKQPLGKILDKLEQIKAGELDKSGDIPENFTYEIRQLGEYADDMASAIDKRENDIKDQLKFTRNILDTQESVVAIASMEGIVDANRSFFELFRNYENIEDFKKHHDCICEFFLDTGMKGYIKKVDKKDSFGLYREIAANREGNYKVAMEINGDIRYFSLKAGNLFLADAEYFTLVFTDITDAENYRLFLEERVREEVEKNRESDKMIYDLKRQKSLSELITSIAHQWRQPLNTVVLTLNDIEDMLIMDAFEKDQALKEITISKEEIQYISDVINTFTGLYKPDALKVDFMLSEVVTDTINMMRLEIEKNDCDLQTDIDPNITLHGSKEQLYNVFKKLIENSLEQAKKTHTQNNKITIKAAATEAECLITIEDNAGGIDTSIIETLFDPYTTTDFQSRGKGLSLYLVKNVVEFQFNGTIKAKNIDGGACMEVRIPLV